MLWFLCEGFIKVCDFQKTLDFFLGEIWIRVVKLIVTYEGRNGDNNTLTLVSRDI